MKIKDYINDQITDDMIKLVDTWAKEGDLGKIGYEVVNLNPRQEDGEVWFRVKLNTEEFDIPFEGLKYLVKTFSRVN